MVQFLISNEVDVIILLGFLLFFTFFSIKSKALDRNGVLIANSVGLIVFLLGGLTNFLAITVFFLIAEVSTRYSGIKTDIKHSKRTTGNIIGNSAAAIIALFLTGFVGPVLAGIGFYSAVSAALADTVSSEIGLTSKKKPVLITNFKSVAPGTDGAITLKGTIAGVTAAIVIAVYYYYFDPSLITAIAIVLAGFVGMNVDSVLGALLERKKILNNTQVNFLGSLSGMIAGIILSQVLILTGL